MNTQQRILRFITRTNWVLFFAASALGFVFASTGFAKGILFGGLIVTINFHLLARTLRKSLKPPRLASPNTILAKYYIRFLISGVIIFFLISGHHVDPIGLFVGLSIVVTSMMLAALCEVKKLFFKEAI